MDKRKMIKRALGQYEGKFGLHYDLVAEKAIAIECEVEQRAFSAGEKSTEIRSKWNEEKPADYLRGTFDGHLLPPGKAIVIILSLKKEE